MKDWREDLLFTVDETRGLEFAEFVFCSTDATDHTHCSICWAKISDSVASDYCGGYYCEKTNDSICPQCFEDFKERLNWKIKK